MRSPLKGRTRGAVESGSLWHLNCATMCPRGKRILTGEGNPLATTTIVAHCLLIEAGDELVLVDTGLGMDDCAKPSRLGRTFRTLTRPKRDPDETAFRQIWKLDLDPRDVRHIVTTHLDNDHAGGLSDFPWADVHIYRRELDAARKPNFHDRHRYLDKQWAHDPKWAEHEPEGDDWFGFESVRLLPDLDVEIAMVPLVGHSAGHAGVAVKTESGWLLHCGDAFFYHGEIETPRRVTPGWELFETLTEHDHKTRQHNQERLRELAREHGDEVTLICSHDPLMMAGV
jgi:glyoxylase-like metal-dependent hydrolase (beta-lactamase superfamily II)